MIKYFLALILVVHRVIYLIGFKGVGQISTIEYKQPWFFSLKIYAFTFKGFFLD